MGTHAKGAMSRRSGVAEPRPLDRAAECPRCPHRVQARQGKQRVLRYSSPRSLSRRQLNHAILRIQFLPYFLQTTLHPGWPITHLPQRQSREAHMAGQIHDKAHHTRRKDDHDSELEQQFRGNVLTSKMQYYARSRRLQSPSTLWTRILSVAPSWLALFKSDTEHILCTLRSSNKEVRKFSPLGQPTKLPLDPSTE